MTSWISIAVGLSHFHSPRFCNFASCFSSALTLRASSSSLRKRALFLRQRPASSTGSAPGIGTGLAERAAHHAATGHHDVIGNIEVPDEADHAGDHAAFADNGAAGNTGTGRYHRVLADAHVMRHLNLIIKLDAVPDHGVLNRAPVDACAGADFDVIADPHATELRHLDPAGRLRVPSRSRRNRSRHPGAE